MSYQFRHHAGTTARLMPVVQSSHRMQWPVQRAPVQTPGPLDLRAAAVEAVNAVLDALDAAGDSVRRAVL